MNTTIQPAMPTWVWLAIGLSWALLTSSQSVVLSADAEYPDTATWAWDTDESDLALKAHEAAAERVRAYRAGRDLPARTADEFLLRRRDSLRVRGLPE